MEKDHVAQLIPNHVHGTTVDHEHFVREVMTRYKALFDSNMFGVAATDFRDTIFFANDAFLSLIGYAQEDLKDGKITWSKISPHEYDETDAQKINELLLHKTVVPFEKEYIHKDGHAVSVLVGAEAFDADITCGVCFALDISEMKELERRKDDFVGMVSHELKTPLSIMKLYADFLKTAIQDGSSKEELLESAHEINSQIDKLNVLITDLLTMARYQTNKNAFLVNVLDVHECVRKIVSELSLVHDRNIIFQGEKAIFISGNEERLTQVITNLVNNAIRYSDDTTDIIVRVYHDHEKAYTEVEDFGIGIHHDDLERIFERYYRVNHADKYGDRGAGIGLYVCKEIVTFHKGKISVKSVLGKGSLFKIELPLVRTT